MYVYIWIYVNICTYIWLYVNIWTYMDICTVCIHVSFIRDIYGMFTCRRVMRFSVHTLLWREWRRAAADPPAGSENVVLHSPESGEKNNVQILSLSTIKGKKKQNKKNMKAELEASLQRCSCMYLWWVCLSSDATGGRRLWSLCGPASRTSPPPARCLDRRRRDDGRACRNIVDIIMSVNIIKNHLVCFYDWGGEILYL